jgi:hypothetical protein
MTKKTQVGKKSLVANGNEPTCISNPKFFFFFGGVVGMMEFVFVPNVFS